MPKPVSDSESDTNDEPEYQLREVLRQRSIRSAFDKTCHDFVPEGVIDEVITLDQVEKCLKVTYSSNEGDELVQFVMTGAKRAFAIAVFAKIDVVKTLRWLMAENINDDKLPIIKPKKKSWSSNWKGDFCDSQWRFFAPIFNSTKHSHIFEEPFILPFVNSSVVTGKGSFGEVSRTEIHSDHMKPVRSNP